MSKTAIILQVLRDVGIYEQVRAKVKDDTELVRMFDQDFDGLVQLVSK